MNKAEVDYDPQHGPIVRVTIDRTTVAVYLLDETAVGVTPEGLTFGMEVKGPWHLFRDSLRALI